MLVGIRKPKKIAVFISGNGSTLQTFLDMQHQLQIVTVISSKKNTRGELKAKRYGIPTFHFSKIISYQDLSKHLLSLRVDLIFLAGFMKILPPEFVQTWQHRIFNIHPSLLPDFPGLNAIENSYESNQEMGATIHEVTNVMDGGPRFLQQASLTVAARPLQTANGAVIFLRRTEQHLLREFILRRAW